MSTTHSYCIEVTSVGSAITSCIISPVSVMANAVRKFIDEAMRPRSEFRGTLTNRLVITPLSMKPARLTGKPIGVVLGPLATERERWTSGATAAADIPRVAQFYNIGG